MANWTADDLFRWWIVQQQSAVMVHLGKITNPVSGKVERDLETARLLIDLIAAVESKTKGNLSADEARFLGGVLTNLRLNFVQEASRPDAPETGDSAGPSPDGAGASAQTTPPGDAPGDAPGDPAGSQPGDPPGNADGGSGADAR